MARGGIVTRPTLALIGEKGPEAVIPLPRSTGTGVGGNVIYLTINGFAGDEHALVEKIRSELIRGGRRMPGILGGLA